MCHDSNLQQGVCPLWPLHKYGQSALVRVIYFIVMSGEGAAYGTVRREHVLNVPAAKMSCVPGEDDHLVRVAFSIDSESKTLQAISLILFCNDNSSRQRIMIALFFCMS